MKPTATSIRTTPVIPALLGVFITLGTVWGLNAAYASPVPEPVVAIVEAPQSVPIAATPKPVPPPPPPKRIVVTVPPPTPTPTPQPTPVPVVVTPPPPTVKKVTTVVMPSRRTAAS